MGKIGNIGSLEILATPATIDQINAIISAIFPTQNGEIAIGSTPIDGPVLNTLTAGTGISITNGPGTISISATGEGLAWVDVTVPTQQMAVDTGYISDDPTTQIDFILPRSAGIGDALIVLGKAAGGWKITYGAGQQIVVGISSSTATTGSISSTQPTDCIHLICSTASATAPIFTAISVQGNLSIT